MYLKQKFETESTSISEKLQILTIILQSWITKKTCNFFDTNENVAKKARRFKKRKGSLGILGLKIASSAISEQVIKDATKILWKC